MRVLLYITFLNLSFSVHAECRRGIANIFTGGETFEEIATEMGTGFKSVVGNKCVEELGVDVFSENYCNCISKNEKTDFDKSRKAFRKKSGKQLKGTIFEIAQDMTTSDNSDLTLNCKLNETLKRNCDQQMIDELFPEYLGYDLGTELGKDFFEIFSSSSNDKNTINQFRTNICQSSLGNDSNVGMLTQTDLDNACVKFEKEVVGFCKGEALTDSEFDTFDFDVATAEDVDNYNYFCKIKDKERRKDISNNILLTIKKAHESLNWEVEPTCNKICIDEAPYSIHGCHVDQEKALAEFKNAGCIDNIADPNCTFLKEAIGNQLLKDFKSGELGEEDLAYFKDHLHKDDYDKIEERIEIAKLQSNSMRKGSLVSQFFESKDGEAFDLGNGTKETKVAKTTPKTAPQKIASQNQEATSQRPSMQQAAHANNMAAVEQGQGPQDNVGPIQGQASSGRLRMGARGRKSRKISQKTKQIAQTIKTLREAGSSLADALAQQEKRLKKEHQKIAQENRDKYQRYDAETLQPIVRGPSDSNNRSNRHSPLANVSSSYGESGSSMPSGGATSGGTGSSTFLPPEKKATVVDVTGRSAPNLDLNSLKSSGATLPSSITNHPDASEISKMFNGLEYQKGQGEGRGPASAKSNIKKIKVDWGASSIDLGSLLINAKDLKPGEEFIVYKGDMDKYVKLVPAYRFRAGKRVFIGYRIENRSSENADLAASIFAKKFLIL